MSLESPQYKPNPCPSCGGPVRIRSNRSNYCAECYQRRYKPQETCSICKGTMSLGSGCCRSCRDMLAGDLRQMTEPEAAWTAGIVEGEGSFTFKSRPRLAVAMTDHDIIERLRSVTGVGLIYDTTPAEAHHKMARLWTVQRSRHVKGVITAIYPWLGERRRQAADATLALIATKPVAAK